MRGGCPAEPLDDLSGVGVCREVRYVGDLGADGNVLAELLGRLRPVDEAADTRSLSRETAAAGGAGRVPPVAMPDSETMTAGPLSRLSSTDS